MKSGRTRLRAQGKIPITEERLGARGPEVPPRTGVFYLQGAGPWRLGRRRGMPGSERRYRSQVAKG